MIKPLISVVMAVYNGEKYLQEAIESILNQSFKRFEFIIINDGSTDNSRKIIESYKDDRIQLVNQTNRGLPKALNIGIELAKGKYIARMDADDISYDNRLAIQYDFLEKNVKVVSVGSNADIIDMAGIYVYRTNLAISNDELKDGLPYQSPFVHPSVLMRRSTLIELGLYPEVSVAQDLFLFIKIREYGEYANIAKPLIKYRLTPSASTRRSDATQELIRLGAENYYKQGILNLDTIKLISDSIKETRNDLKFYYYHLLLAKKYLWNNFQPKLVRVNSYRALFNGKLSAIPLFLIFLSFLPKRGVVLIYSNLKKSKG